MTDQRPPTPEEENEFLAAEYALGLSEGENLTTARERARRDPTFAGIVAAWHERLVGMTDSIAPVEPPSRIRKSLIKSLFPTPAVPFWQRVWVWQGISFAALALLAFLAMPMLRPDAPTLAGPIYGTQMTGDIDDLQVYAVLDPSRGGIAVTRTAGSIPEGRVLELWALLPDAAPVSLGLVPEDSSHLKLPPEIADQIGQLTLAISDEPPGGAPDGAPTGQIRATGAVEEI
ncbi:Anti-sigma-K factor rskA [Sulfitobacter sp. THAF37]|uniref:anti-sigma factor n=1 Tax=Sulfitobacter sp. THAF37 TaxID=2587855 RepID=UPI001269263C|nr:anti-sigma factor [Sulfitobacter sp. THAF37]QFT59069.1 Anti-sigma-K factor rskA [Sulfitobacter sp. THAF37]